MTAKKSRTLHPEVAVASAKAETLERQRLEVLGRQPFLTPPTDEWRPKHAPRHAWYIDGTPVLLGDIVETDIPTGRGFEVLMGRVTEVGWVDHLQKVWVKVEASSNVVTPDRIVRKLGVAS